MYKYRLKEIGKQRCISMGSLIQRATGVSRSTASHYMNLKQEDLRSIPSDHFREIAKALGVQMEDLYTQAAEV